MAECVGTPDCCFSGTASCRGGGQSCCQEWKLLLRLRPHGCGTPRRSSGTSQPLPRSRRTANRTIVSEPTPAECPSHILGVSLCADTYSVQDKQAMLDAAEACTKALPISHDALFQAKCHSERTTY